MSIASLRTGLAAVVAASTASLALAQGTIQSIGSLQAGGGSRAARLSSDGQVVVGDAAFDGYYQRAFRWTQATGIVNIDPDAPAHTNSRALGVSADGSFVTGYRTDLDSNSFAFRWSSSAGLVLLPDVPGGIGGRAGGISADGQVVAGEGAETFSNGGGVAARWSAGGVVSQLPMFEDSFSGEALDVSPDGHVIVGFCSHGDLEANPFYFEVEACRWVDGTLSGLGRLPGAASSFARATHASTDGSAICGFGYDGEETQPTMHAFRWTAGGAGGLALLPELPGSDQTEALGISDGGTTIVGTSHMVDGWHAAIWIDGSASDLATTLSTSFGVDLTGWTLTEAAGISADGRSIAGTGTFTAAGGQPLGQAWIVHLPLPIWSPPGACYANCDGSLSLPRLNIADFTCFLQKFAAGDSYANCDHSSVQPVLNVADFGCFLQKFAAGCP